MFQYPAASTQPNLQHAGQALIRTRGDYPQSFKLVLRSADRDPASSKMAAQFLDVRLPEGCGTGPATFVVESFAFETGLAGAAHAGAVGFEVSIPELTHPRSFDTRARGCTDVVCYVPAAHTHFSQSVTAHSLGTPVTDPNFFRNTRLTVVLRTLDNETGRPLRPDEALLADLAFAGEWVLVAHIIV
jgi:hypothetical protein